MVSRFYASSAGESTAGAPQTATKSWFVKGCTLDREEDYALDDEITGNLAPVSATRERTRAAGSLMKYAQPDFCAWLFKFLYGAAPSSALVAGGTSTVYEHSQTAFSTPPLTFTAITQIAGITNYIQRYCGIGVTGITFKGSKGKIEVEAKLEGLCSNYARSPTVSEPVVSVITLGEGYLVGTNANLYVDGTALTKGTFDANWTLSIDSGYALQDEAGSDDGTPTAFDLNGPRKVTFDYSVIEKDVSNIDDFTNETFHSYEVRMPGPLIDVANSLNSLVALKINKGRAVAGVKSAIGSTGRYRLPIRVESIIDTSTGYHMQTRVRNLQASY